MLTCINTILEMLATIICVNNLFCPRYIFKIHDAIFLLTEVIVIESGNYLGLSKAVALFGYIGIYILELTKFRCSIRKANVNFILASVFCVFVQVLCSIPVFALAKWVNMDILVTSVNGLLLIVFYVLSKKNIFYKISKSIMGYEMLSNIATGICFVGAVYLLVVYKLEEYLRITDYVIFGAWTILIGVLIVSWQRERFDKISKERELELRQSYDSVYEQLLQSIRKKQHDFHNQITAIYSHHLIAQDYDTLVMLQRKYCEEILSENRYANLVSNGSPMIVAFLYSKFIEAESKGCHIEYDVKGDKFACRIPQYKIIDILGVLLDNAIEAVEESASRNIYVGLIERTDLIHIVVKNDTGHIEKDDIALFVKPGYSTKNYDRGIGLSKIIEILQAYDCELDIYCEKDSVDRIVFEFDIEKR